MIVIGLTGPTGAGKTTALAALAGLGFEIVDCDRLYYWLGTALCETPWRLPSAPCFCRTEIWTGGGWRPGSLGTRRSWHGSTPWSIPPCPLLWNKKFEIVHKKDLLLMR